MSVDCYALINELVALCNGHFDQRNKFINQRRAVNGHFSLELPDGLSADSPA
jgi:hypothetical protein